MAMGIDESSQRKKSGEGKPAAKAKSVDPKQTTSVKDFFRVVPRDAELSESKSDEAKKPKPKA